MPDSTGSQSKTAGTHSAGRLIVSGYRLF